MNPQAKALIFAVVFSAFALFLPVQPAQAGDDCSLIVNRNRVSVTVSRGPCSISDFPVWCDAYVPRRIVQGQTIQCETIIIVITATPTPRPQPTATRAAPAAPPRPLGERIWRILPPQFQRH